LLMRVVMPGKELDGDEVGGAVRSGWAGLLARPARAVWCLEKGPRSWPAVLAAPGLAGGVAKHMLVGSSSGKGAGRPWPGS